MRVRLDALLIGVVRPLGKSGRPSGIAKEMVDHPLRLSCEGFEGDAQGDRRHHGGPDKAVHHYPLEHYALWRAEIGPRVVLDRAGAFGENLSTTGMD